MLGPAAMELRRKVCPLSGTLMMNLPTCTMLQLYYAACAKVQYYKMLLALMSHTVCIMYWLQSRL
jgi:hypothetical protein